MSAHDVGYCRIAAGLNRRGWNAVLMHLPYHYSRVPRGHFNGALALTSNLPQNGETMRQAVMEVRQLMEYLRENGCPDFGMIGTSYGGWVGALVSFLEREFRFVTLLQPIADVEHAIWESPASSMIRSFADCRNPSWHIQAARASYFSFRWETGLRGRTCSGDRWNIRYNRSALCIGKLDAGLARLPGRSSRTRTLRLCSHAGSVAQS